MPDHEDIDTNDKSGDVIHDNNLPEIYFKSLGNISVLTKTEETALFKKWKENGDTRIKYEIIRRNLRLVINIAAKFRGRGMDYEDIIQEGNIGMMTAVEKFDHSKGYKFSTYAVHWIRQRIRKALVDQSRTVRVPGHITGINNTMLRIEHELRLRLCREPEIREIAEAMNITEDRVREMHGMRELSALASLDEPIGDDDGHLQDFVVDDSVVHSDINCIEKEMMQDIFIGLTYRESEILKMRFGIDCEKDHTLQEVGDHFNITRERVRQIERQAIRKIRRRMILKKRQRRK